MISTSYFFIVTGLTNLNSLFSIECLLSPLKVLRHSNLARPPLAQRYHKSWYIIHK